MTPRPNASRPRRFAAALALGALLAQWLLVTLSVAHHAHAVAAAQWSAVCRAQAETAPAAPFGAVTDHGSAGAPCPVCAVAAMPLAPAGASPTARTGTGASRCAAAPQRAPAAATGALRPPVRAPPRA